MSFQRPRIRFTIRRLMIVVAGVAVLIGVGRETLRLHRLAQYYRTKASENAVLESSSRDVLARLTLELEVRRETSSECRARLAEDSDFLKTLANNYEEAVILVQEQIDAEKYST